MLKIPLKILVHKIEVLVDCYLKSVGMGNCLCKDGNEETEHDPDNSTRAMGATILSDNHVETIAVTETTNYKFPTSTNIDKLVLEILEVIGLLVDK